MREYFVIDGHSRAGPRAAHYYQGLPFDQDWYDSSGFKDPWAICCCDKTPSGVSFDYDLTYSGACFLLVRTQYTTDAAIEAAKAWLRANRDVVSIRVVRLNIVKSHYPDMKSQEATA